jgi:hypothetical protein
MEESRGFPEVVDTYPKDNGMNAPVDTRIMALFSRRVKRSDINEFTFTLNDGVSDIATNVRYNSELKKAILIPLEDLLPKHVYYITVSKTIRDDSGNSMERDYSFKFKTVNSIVNISPIISRISPTVGSSNVSTDVNLEMFFSTDMDQQTLTEDNIIVKQGKKKIIGIVRYYQTLKRVVFVPDSQLAYDSVYTISVKNVKASNGTPMESERVWSFRTIKKKLVATRDFIKSRSLKKVENRLRRISDKIKRGSGNLPEMPDHLVRVADGLNIIPPILVEQYPASDVEMVRVDSNVKVKFSKKMDPSTLTIFNFSLREGKDFIFGRVEYNSKTLEGTFIPAGKLKPNTTYTVLLSKKIKDSRGKSIGENVKWTFKTVTAIATFTAMRNKNKNIQMDLAAPHVVTTTPADRGEEVISTTEIYALFSEQLRSFTVNSFTFRVNDGENDIEGKVGYDVSLKRAWFKPAVALENGRTYIAFLTRGIMDKSGIYMQKEKRFRFIVGRKWKTSTPRLLSLTPEPGTIAAGSNFRISATFSEKLNASTVNRETVMIYDGDRLIHGLINISNNGTTINFKPAEMMKPGGNYTFKISKELEGISGNRVENPYNYSYGVGREVAGNRMKSKNINSIAGTHDAILDMKVVKSMQSKPIYDDILKNSANFQIGPDEMEKRMNLSDKFPGGKVKRITPNDDDGKLSRKHILNKSLVGEDIAFKDDVKAEIERFLGEDRRKNKKILKKISEVNDKEKRMALSKVVSANPITGVRNGKKEVNSSGTLIERGGSFFKDDLKYDIVETKAVVKDNSAYMPPTSNIIKTSKFKSGSGMINGVSVNSFDSNSTLTSPLDELRVVKKIRKERDLISEFSAVGNDSFMVTSIHPRRNKINVNRDEIISVSFNKNIDLSSVNDLTFIVTRDEELVEGKIVYNPRMSKVIFRPKGKFKSESDYKIILTNGVRNLDGESLKPIKWNFKTRT